MKITGASKTHKKAMIFIISIESLCWFIEMKKMLRDDILLWWYCLHCLGIFHTKTQNYINISQLRANYNFSSINNQQEWYSDIWYTHSNIIFIQKNEKDATWWYILLMIFCTIWILSTFNNIFLSFRRTDYI